MEEQKNEEVELLKPRIDIVFQALFQGNKENITESFISDILGEKIKIIDIKTDNTLMRKYPNDKTGRLDLKTKFEDGTICQVEMQLSDEKNTIKRLLYYWSKTYSDQLKRGGKYKELKKTIGIIIINYELAELKETKRLDTKWQITSSENGKKILTDDLELRIIEIPKAIKILEKEGHNRIAQWITFIDNPNTERVEEIMKENKEVEKAREVLHVMSEDEELKRLAELKEKWELDERSSRDAWKEEGLEEGRALGKELGIKEGREEGRQEGRQEGLEEGRQEGEKSKTIEIAKKMRKKNISVEEIAEITGLTIEAIEKL